MSFENPLLSLPAVQRLQALDPQSRAALREVLLDLGVDAGERAELCWKRHKGPMAAYWKAVAVYARHAARVLRPETATEMHCQCPDHRSELP